MTKCQANLNTDRNCLHCLLNFMANFQLLAYNSSEKAYFKVGNIEEGSCKLRILGRTFNIRYLVVQHTLNNCDLFYRLVFRKSFLFQFVKGVDSVFLEVLNLNA